MSDISFGITPLDDLLHGLSHGENVVWNVHSKDQTSADLAREIISSAVDRNEFARLVLVFSSDSSAELIGWDSGSAAVTTVPTPADAAALLGDGGSGRVLVVVDSRSYLDEDDIDLAIAQDSALLALQIVRTGSVGYWFDSTSGLDQGIKSLAQVVIEIDDGQLRVQRADARGSEVRGAILPCRIEDGSMVVDATSAASLLGRGLRSVRRERGWSQAHLAWMVGVTGSAISQAERGHHALSLETVLDLADKLGITVDQLVRGQPLSYELSRADAPDRFPGGSSRIVSHGSHAPGPDLRLRTVVTKIPPRGSASPSFAADRPQILLVGRGLIQVVLPTARPILRAGDVLTILRDGVASCRNVGEEEALLFWQEIH